MTSRLITVLVIVLCFCLRNYGCSRVMVTTTPGEEDMEMERELQSLNKPPVKTIQLEEAGDIIDCIDILSQPALDNPSLKNHKIQMRPTSFPDEMKKPVLMSTDPVQDWSKSEACPYGTVPIHRTTKDDLVKAKALSHQMFPNIGNINALAPNTHHVYLRMNQTEKVTYSGVSGSSSVYKLNLPLPEQSSTASVWVEKNANFLYAGWMVSPSIMGDDNPRLFIYWTADDGKTGCFNLLCKGFVQVDRSIGPKTAYAPVSTVGGQTYDTKFSIYQDPMTKNWWLLSTDQNVSVGYWPKEILPGLLNGAGQVGWGGISMAKKDEHSPPMGSGQYPDGFYDHAAFFRNIHYLVEGLKPIVPSDNDPVYEFADKSGCYALQNDKDTGLEFWGYRFSFGGPGGACGN